MSVKPVYREIVRSTVQLALETLVNNPLPIDSALMLGTVRSLALKVWNAPLDVDTLKELQGKYLVFMLATPVHPDDVLDGVAYRDMKSFNTVGTVKYGKAANGSYVRMDLTKHKEMLRVTTPRRAPVYTPPPADPVVTEEPKS